MADDTLTGQYSVVASFIAGYKPTWLAADALNGARIGAYSFYKNLYWNDVGGFRLTLRGDEEFPVYIPSARRIINTFNRYYLRGLDIAISGQTTEQVEAAKLAFDVLFKRERFKTLVKHQKREGLILGDWILGLFADPNKPEGRRISILPVDPAQYFPIANPRNSDEIWGQALIEPVTEGDKVYIRVQRWIKPVHPDHPSFSDTPDYEAPIAYEDVWWEQENWNDPTKRKAFRTVVPLDVLDGISTLPLYHFANDRQRGNAFGTSDLKGLERIFLAINQTATDEDISIAMAGLGMYVSDATPVDDDGNRTDWILGPKRVVEVPKGGLFTRVSGVASVEPSQSHMDWLQKQAESVLGISDVALGQVDVAVAESGIALALRMGPLLDAAGDRDQESVDVLNQMFHDLKQWFLIYEKINLGDDITGAVIECVLPDKLPEDRAAKLDRLAQLFQDRVISLEFYWGELIKLGFDISIEEMRRQIEEDGAVVDPTGDRLNQEAIPGEVIEDGGSE